MKDIFLIDLDDTLLDFGRAERANLQNVFSRFGISADESFFARFHAINDGLWKALERGEIGREALKVRRFELLFRELGVRADAAAVADAYFRGFPELCFPFEGAAEFLAALAGRGRIYLVTNGGAQIQKRHIELSGFAPFLSGAFISEEIGADKPSAAFADYVEGHIPGYRRENAVWIGDSLTSDRLCAEGRGIDFIWFSPRGGDRSRDCAHGFAELWRLLFD